MERGITMRNKMIALVVLLLSLIFIAVGCGSNEEPASNSSNQNEGSTEGNNNAEAPAESITLSFASASPATAPFTTGYMEPFMERVTELTEGQVEFEFYPAEQLGKAADLLDLTANGVVDIGYYGASFYPSKMPISSKLVALPGLHSNAYQQTMAFHELALSTDILEVDFLSNGVRPILNSGIPPYEFYTKGTEIRVPADLRGLKVRTTGGAGTAMLEYAGATPVSVNTPDMFEAFDSGIIDVVYQFPRTMQSYGLQELVRYGTQGAAFGSSIVGFVINENLYQGLLENVKEAIHQAAEEIMESYSSSSDEENHEVLAMWIDELNIPIYELSAEEANQWVDFAAEFNEQYLKGEDDSDMLLEILNKYQELLKKYE